MLEARGMREYLGLRESLKLRNRKGTSRGTAEAWSRWTYLKSHGGSSESQGPIPSSFCVSLSPLFHHRHLHHHNLSFLSLSFSSLEASRRTNNSWVRCGDVEHSTCQQQPGTSPHLVVLAGKVAARLAIPAFLCWLWPWTGLKSKDTRERERALHRVPRRDFPACAIRHVSPQNYSGFYRRGPSPIVQVRDPTKRYVSMAGSILALETFPPRGARGW